MYDNNFTKQHIKTVIFASYLQFVKDHYPQLEVSKICQEAGLSLEYIQNENNWVSIEFDKRFLDIIKKATKHKNLAFEAGKYGVRQNVLGASLYFLLKYIVPLETGLRQSFKYAALFNKLITIKTIESRRGYLKTHFFPNTEGLTEVECEYLTELMPEIIESTKGYYTAIPTLKSLPEATVNVSKVTTQTSHYYEMIVKFQPENILLKTTSGVFSVLWSLVIFFFCITYFKINVTNSFLVSLVLPVGLYIAKLQHRNKTMEKVALQTERTLLALDQKYKETAALSDSFSRFVPWETLSLLNYKSIFEVQIGDGLEKEMSILFSDIRGFTKLCESMSPSQTLKFLNSYFGKLSPIIKKNNGTIDKFIGDCLMAIFKSPVDAITAGVEIQRDLIQYNIERRIGGRKLIEAGIGICHGPVVVGPLGFDRRLELTVLSDTVNIASRLDGMCKPNNARILYAGPSLDTLNLPSELQIKHHGDLPVKGKRALVSVEEIIDFNMLKAIDLRTVTQNEIETKQYVASLEKELQDKRDELLQQNSNQRAA